MKVKKIDVKRAKSDERELSDRWPLNNLEFERIKNFHSPLKAGAMYKRKNEVPIQNFTEGSRGPSGP